MLHTAITHHIPTLLPIELGQQASLRDTTLMLVGSSRACVKKPKASHNLQNSDKLSKLLEGNHTSSKGRSVKEEVPLTYFF
jgi:hypothetical protein